MLVGSLMVVAEPAAAQADPPGSPDGFAGFDDADGPEPMPWTESTSAAIEPPPEDGVLGDGGDESLPSDLPEPETWEVDLESPETDRGDSSVVLRPGPDADDVSTAAPDSLSVEVLDQGVAERAGVSGFVFTVDSSDETLELESTEEMPIELEVDYSTFAGAFGGDYADRLQVVALPACALEDPVPDDCRTAGVPVESRNDLEVGRLIVESADLADLARHGADTEARDGAGDPEPFSVTPEMQALAQQEVPVVSGDPQEIAFDGEPAPSDPATPEGLEAYESTALTSEEGIEAPAESSPERSDRSTRVVGEGAVILAVTPSVTSENTNYSATSLGVAGSWQVAPGAGEFSYGYDIPVPAPAGGAAPSVPLGYSSSSVDGMTNASNTQASQVGVGWSDFAGAFIERRYEMCFGSNGPLQTGDLCWKNDNAVISLDGVNGPLLPVNAERTEWRVQGDPNWKIERHTAVPSINGDNDGEYWIVRTPGGTRYVFGRGNSPGRYTNSALTVPVTADHAGEPCWNGGVATCNQAWRWNLDRVIDPNGNTAYYFYDRETNYYETLDGWANIFRPYHRAAVLTEIAYGSTGWEQNYAGRVTFGVQYRCAARDHTCTNPATPANGTQFPDVPNDLICMSTTDCHVNTPSFFSTRRYSHVRTEVRVGNAWRIVAQHNLGAIWGPDSAGQNKRLLLHWIQHVGLAQGGLMIYEPVRIDYIRHANRVDHNEAGGRSKMENWRAYRLTNEFGAVTTVTYGLNRACAQSYNPPRWDENVRDCFPQTVVDRGLQRQGVFHKYLVTSVKEEPGGGSPAMQTDYAYEGDPAWAFDNGAFDRNEFTRGWQVWRGYGTAIITQGNSVRRVRVFRGMDGDAYLQDAGGGNLVPTGERSVSVESLDGSRSFVDDHALAGRTLEEESLGELDGVAGATLQSTLYEYDVRVTHPLGSGYLHSPTWAGVSATTESVAVAPGEFRQRGGTTTYDAHQQPVATLEAGWLDDPTDDRCSLTTYAEDASRHMLNFPASNTLVAGDCSSTSVLSRSEIYYDDSPTLGAIPGTGNPTRQRTQLDAGTWSETSTTFDSLGRPVTVTDANGETTTTSHVASPANAIPTSTTVTNALGHVSTTEWLPEFGVPLRETDANQNVTTYAYDAFGRVTRVRLPTEQPYVSGAAPSWEFSYFPDPSTRAVRARQLTSTAMTGPTVTYQDSWIVYDGLWRERQVQSLSPHGGQTIVSETTYDGRGLVRDETAAQAVAGTPGALITGVTWDNRTRNLYDELGRPTRTEWWRGQSAAHATVHEYTADTVTVTGPDGHQARETVDGLGRTVATAEHDGDDWVTSNYAYDLADRLTAVSDPTGNTISYTYNLAGWQLTADDPDRGNAAMTYDLAGNKTSVTDGAGNSIHTAFDALGRPVERRSESSSGPLLASWGYDSAPGGVGQLHSETRHAAGGEWASVVDGYDRRGRAVGTTLHVPAGVPGLSGQYPVTQTYDAADRVTSTTYPGVGGLAQETVTTSYNSVGLATSMTGADQYVRAASYDARGRLTATSSGPAGAQQGWMLRLRQYNADQQLASTTTQLEVTGGYSTVSNHELSYNASGNLTSKVSSANGSSWQECYGYDARQRLVEAFTVDDTEACDAGQPGGGDRPFVQSFSYSPDGNLLERVEDGVTTEYSYPSGSDQPHAPTSVGTDAYEWDANGNLVERTVDGETETFTWDDEQRLGSVQSPGGTTSFLYSAGGQRLLRTTDTGSTLYIAGHEIHATTDGSSVTAVRSYSFEGELIATRTPDGVQYLVTSESGSVEMAVPSRSGAPSSTRTYSPYGAVRSEDGAPLPTERGFVGQIEDPTTELSYMNARYYDTSTSMFISTDPLYDRGQIKTLNPYSYAGGNPTTFADPTGTSREFTHGLHLQNGALRNQNHQLRVHIGKLEGHISSLQSIITDQQATIKSLVARVEAMDAIIRQQQSIISELKAKVRYLVGVVNYQRVVIGRLQAKVAYQARVIRYQAGVISYQRGVITTLVGHAFLPEYQSSVLSTIFAGNGIPSWGGSRVNALQSQVDAAGWREWGRSWSDRGRDHKIERLETAVSDLQSDYDGAVAAFGVLYDEYLGITDPEHMSFTEQGCYYGTGNQSLDSDAGFWRNVTGAIWQGVGLTVAGDAAGIGCWALG